MRRRVLLALVAFLLVTSCTANSADTVSTVSTAEPTTAPDLSGDLADAQAEISDLQAQLEALTEEIKTAQSERDQLASDKAALEAEAEEAKATVEELMTRYDPEIQAAIRAGTQSVIDLACENMDGTTVEESVVRDAMLAWASDSGLGSAGVDALDRDAIDAAAHDCFVAAQAQVVLERLQGPKGDGFYTVGEEIAPGTWESQGTADDCYWARYDANQNILDNHFGLAGGRIVIRSSDTEVQFDGCGQWVFKG